MTKTKTTEAVETTNKWVGSDLCACGCHEAVLAATFRPGHDARLVGQLARDLDIKPDTPTAADEDVERAMALLPSLALRAKLARSIASREAKATAARNAADAKAAARDNTPEAREVERVMQGVAADATKPARKPRARKTSEVAE